MYIKEMDVRISDVCDDIKNGEIDLRPDFQRGEVWTSTKKKLLIDSILREWHVPPIHLVTLSDGTYEVLDGQQRLTAIKQFVENRYAIDGYIDPIDDEIVALNNLKYSSLPKQVQKAFDRFTLKIYKITDYNHGEPSELFHRLNQTVKLTSSEARNAIYGNVRDNISDLVSKMNELDINRDILGFSNSRMAYNDLLSRVAIFVEDGSLRTVVNDSVLNKKYRDVNGFKQSVLDALSYAIDIFGFIREEFNSEHVLPSLTKASSLNWFYLFASIYENGLNVEIRDKSLTKAFFNLELARSYIKLNIKIPIEIIDYFGFDESVLRELMLVYIERSSSRVMSVGSILIRDMIIRVSCIRAGLYIGDSALIKNVISELESGSDPKSVLEDMFDAWGGK
ncbi:DUF262 domain-containing protein [Plesiomonas shigelloides]|uniref:DUF262 domain-containing protein n=1 Tax=Plesiomonas shigelloides TaxID=703 RepID=UPI001261C38A|nr:DUF262 domain-containing protein [Plesiomonas shigelloides]KAB7689971.1 DUF262 domain-containing protein [Plesiomonas shigelloides]MDO4687461.1 DUF262 domain-containing protein [Plesiomonas sp.]